MERNEYNKAIENTKRNYHSSVVFLAIIIDVFLIPFVFLPMIACTFVFTKSVIVTAIVSILSVVAVIVVTVLVCKRINANTDDQVQSIYCKEIPVECPSCASHFSVIAGNAEKCPYCGTLVLVDNQGRIVQRD